MLQKDPSYPGVHFHQVSRGKDTLYSVYVGIHYRALAWEQNGELYWFWIGPHTVYDAILAGQLDKRGSSRVGAIRPQSSAARQSQRVAGTTIPHRAQTIQLLVSRPPKQL